MPELLTHLEWREPLLLLSGLLAPLAAWLAARTPGRITYSSLDLVSAAPRTLRMRLRHLPAALLALAVLCLAVALAGPRTGDARTAVQQRGIAIMLAVDRSGSMDARDFVRGDYSLSRLDVVKRTLERFVLGGDGLPGRPQDLIGLVAFGTYADAAAPATLDHRNLRLIIDQLEVARERSEAATAVGEGLALAVEHLRRLEQAQSRVIVLLTDGVSNADEIDPLQAAELAHELGMRVYTVGAGSSGVAPMPVRTPDGRTILRPARVEIDEQTLQRIAEITGGRYFHARDAQALERTYAEIDALERSDISEVRYLQYREHYPAFVIAALLLSAAALLSAHTWLRRLP